MLSIFQQTAQQGVFVILLILGLLVIITRIFIAIDESQTKKKLETYQSIHTEEEKTYTVLEWTKHYLKELYKEHKTNC